MFGDRSNDPPHNPGGTNPTRPDAGGGVVVDARPSSPDACTVGCFVSLEFAATLPFGSGTEYSLPFQKAGSGNLVIESSHPEIAEVVAVVDGSSKYVTLRGKTPGTAALIARHGNTDEVLDVTTVIVMHVANVQLEYRSGPGLDAPVTSLASLAGASDSFGIVYRSASGERLAGRGGFSATGGVAIDPGEGEFRPSNLYGAGLHARVAVVVNGSGTLVATLANDGREFVWPIDVVAQPATISLVPMYVDSNNMLAVPPATGVKVSALVGVDIIGRTLEGRFVVGVEALWSATPGLSLFITPSTTPTTEGVFRTVMPGTHVVSALSNGTTYTQQVVVIP
jgi:hypothetical protein